MSNTEHPAGAAHRSFRCTFGPVREVDLVWPPTDEDVDAFTVIHLDDSDAEPPRIEPPTTEPPTTETAGTEPVGPDPARFGPFRLKPAFGDCRARGAAARVRPLVVPMEPPPLPGPVGPDTPGVPPLQPFSFSDALPPDPEAAGAGRSAWLAVFFAAACALVTFAEYRRISTPVDGPEAPPVPAQVSVAIVPAPDARAVPPSPTSEPATAERRPAAPPARPMSAPTPKLARAPEPGPSVPRVAVDARDPGIAAANAEPRVTPTTARTEPQPALAARAEVPPPPAPVAAASPEPLAKATPSPPAMSTPVAAVLADSASDEADIRSTLTRFRTAYSQLNASAARDVWPSVDARALERAFGSLKSQDLRFDSCTMTVTGARAQAACRGRAVYVPRIGDQSPRFTSREWNFELRKADERWTIASARSL